MRSLGLVLIQLWLASLKEEEIRTQTHPREDQVETEGGDTIYRPKREESSEETSPADTLILDFQPPELWENKFLLFKSPGLWYFLVAALANDYNSYSFLIIYTNYLKYIPLCPAI